jgi:hypothetical protein
VGLSGTDRYEVRISWVPEGNGRAVESLIVVEAPNKAAAITYALRNAALAGAGIPYDPDIRSVSL